MLSGGVHFASEALPWADLRVSLCSGIWRCMWLHAGRLWMQQHHDPKNQTICQALIDEWAASTVSMPPWHRRNLSCFWKIICRESILIGTGKGLIAGPACWLTKTEREMGEDASVLWKRLSALRQEQRYFMSCLVSLSFKCQSLQPVLSPIAHFN